MMASKIRKIGFLIQSFGFDPRRFAAAVGSVAPFSRAYATARKKSNSNWPIHFMPALGDRGASAGSARGHYFHMDLWAARRVFSGKFGKVVDVGSRVDGYVAHVLCFRDIEVFDVRPMSSAVEGMSFAQADMMNPTSLPENYTDCVTCLHALEHFGLGRYGDPVDLSGWLKGLSGLTKILAAGGTLLLAVPIGRQRVEFDAHRVFHPETITAAATELGLELVEFSMVDDNGNYFENANVSAASQLEYGCGCFRFLRK